ncbi:hypothetical protein AAIR98_001216 [Elusimicrobium simillimum]|uniref:YggS family pyridoxal phosphate-dependent enzyme n=1 Tax=Elusimicrobium simillimum TaxID=3143438 RepID=UPI003C6FBCC4
MQKVITNYNTVLEGIKAACSATHTNFENVHPMAVIKYAKEEDILTLLSHNGGPVHAGESKLQDAMARWAKTEFNLLRPRVTLHFIGQLQKNKIAKIVNLFDFIDSIASFETAVFTDAKAKEQGKTVNCMVQVKLTDSVTQSGVKMADAPGLIKQIRTLANINLLGIMAIAPQADNAEDLRPVFKEVKQLWDSEFGGVPGAQLSLGMSGDYAAAVREGSTMPRIGSAIFD